MSPVPKVQEGLESKHGPQLLQLCDILLDHVLTKAFWSSLHLNPEEAHCRKDFYSRSVCSFVGFKNV